MALRVRGREGRRPLGSRRAKPRLAARSQRAAKQAGPGRYSKMVRVAIRMALAAIFGALVSAASAQTLNTVKARGVLNCGSNGSLAGFGTPDSQGRWVGFDVDYCRAIAATVFNDPNKVKFVPLTAKDRFTALQSGEVDVL